MSTVLIVSSKAAANATTDDFNTGKAAVGTGPFRFVRWQKGDRIELARNDAYWGPKVPWERVTFRVITSDPTRVASLLAGEVRAIENVPTTDLAKLASNKDLAIYRTVSVRLMYLHLDTAREKTPFATDKAGKALDRKVSSAIFEHILSIKMAGGPQSSGAFASNVQQYETLRDFFTSASLSALIDLPFVVVFLVIIFFIAGPVVTVPAVLIPTVILVSIEAAIRAPVVIWMSLVGPVSKIR